MAASAGCTKSPPRWYSARRTATYFWTPLTTSTAPTRSKVAVRCAPCEISAVKSSNSAHGTSERGPVRRGDDHLVAAIEQGLAGEVERLLAPDRDRDLLRRERDPEILGVTRGHGRAELGQPGRSRVPRAPGVERGRRGLGDVLRRGLVRLAHGEVEHAVAGRAQCGRALGHGDGGRDLQGARPLREVARGAVPLARGLHVRLRRRSPSGGGPGYFSRKRRSTTGGTSSWTAPPSWKTSLPRRDEGEEQLLPGHCYT